MNDVTASPRQWGDWAFRRFDRAWLMALALVGGVLMLLGTPGVEVWWVAFALMAAPVILVRLPLGEGAEARHVRALATWSGALAMTATLLSNAAWMLAPAGLLGVVVMTRHASRRVWGEAIAFCAIGVAAGMAIGGGAPALPGRDAVALGLFLTAVAGLAMLAGAVMRDAIVSYRSLQTMQRELGETLAASPAVHLTLDPAGAVVGAHGPVREVLGLTETELEGLRLDDLIDETGRDPVLSSLGSSRAAGETIIVKATILGRSVRLSHSPALRGFARVGIVHASAEPGELEQLKAARDMAVSDAESKSKFFAQLNHELRTPLNAILGFSDVMRERVFGEMPEQYEDYVNHIHESATHLLGLVGSVIDLSKLEAGAYQLDPERHDARDAVTAAVSMLGVLAERKSIDLVDRSASEPVWVDADPRALRQIAINLVANAIKFTPDGGRVEASVCVQHDRLVLDVADTGPGMSAVELASLGDPYVQTKTGRTSAEPGTGLGLAIVRGLAQMHGGELAARSELGRGSVIGVRAPVLAVVSPPSSQSP